jgi:hypothetical protein
MDGETRAVLLEELRRQDSLIHGVSAELAKKAGLYMVFAGFVFTGTAALSVIAERAKMPVPAVFLLVGMLCALGCVYNVVHASCLEEYRTPPIGQNLIEQTKEFEAHLKRKNASLEQFSARVRGKLANSLARSVRKNFLRNEQVARRLHAAFSWLSASLVLVFAAAAWAPLVRVVAFLASAFRA